MSEEVSVPDREAPSWRFLVVTAGLLGVCLLGCVLAVGGGIWWLTRQESSSDTDRAIPVRPTVAAGPAVSGSPFPAAPICNNPQPPFVTDRQIRQVAPIPEPAARTAFRDPVMGACVVRVTDRKADRSQTDRSSGLKNEYSRVQSFNADGSLFIALGTEHSWYLYETRSLHPLGEIPIQWEPRWDVADPTVVYFVTWGDAGLAPRLMAYNVKTGQQTIEHDFGRDFPGQQLAAVWTRSEGSPSLDGRYWGFLVEDANWRKIAFLVYDLRERRVVAKRDLRGVAGADSIDNVSVSPLGNFFLADYSDYYCERGSLGTDGRPCGVMVYDRGLRNGRGLLRIGGHADLALDAEGREVLVYQDIDTDNISMVDLTTGKVSALLPIDFSRTALGLHVSGRAFRRPGWAVVSTSNGGVPASVTWMDDQVFLVELKPGGRTVRLAHTHSRYDEKTEHDYWAEPHASASQDLTRIVFTSNWGRTGTAEVDMYMILLPPDWPQQLK